ncbi:MAG: sigma-70 family RNA polymerase sigma factor [Marinifilaceae bacterium]|jgi:RNA polymerase sigma-70 factor (ECF subfamily)|nr:sigma-70 family RNA polymerase sigma factor [Marinifilaceae bacterium]
METNVVDRHELLVKTWEENHVRIGKFVLSQTRDIHITEDILQETFVKAHKSALQLRKPERMLSWIYQIARRLIIDIKRKKRPSFHPNEELKHHKAAEDIENIYKNFGPCLKPSIEALPDIYSEVLFNSYLKKVKQHEFANKSDISYSAVKSRVQRAKTLLREELSKCYTFVTGKNGKGVIDFKKKRKFCDKCLSAIQKYKPYQNTI